MSTIDQSAAKELLTRVLESPESSAYRDIYAANRAHVDAVIAGDAAWETLPFLTREQLADALRAQQWFVDEADVGLLQPTSGTSGKGVMLVPRGLQQFGVKDPLHQAPYAHYAPKRFALYFSDQPQYAEILRKAYGIELLALDAGDVTGSVQLLQTFKPDMIGGYVYALEPLAHKLDTDTAALVKSVQVYGERPSQLQWNLLQEKFPNALLVTKYGSMEAQIPVGNGCSELIQNKTQYIHPFAHTVYTEVINPDTGEVLTEPSAEGELVLTTLQQPMAFPLIRYRTNDRVRIVPSECACDRTTYEILGRLVQHAVRVPGGEINTMAIEHALENVKVLLTSFAYEAQYTEKEDRGVAAPALKLNLQWDSDRTTADELARRISEELLVAPRLTYRECVATRGYIPLVVDSMESERGAKQRGIQRI